MNSFSKPNPKLAPSTVSGPKRLIKSVKCNAGSPEGQDETIKQIMAESWDYLETIMIYGGQVIIRFEKRG